MSEELKPCDCGGKPLIVRHAEQSGVNVYVECRKCEAQGPRTKCNEEAVEAWNRRATPPAAQVQGEREGFKADLRDNLAAMGINASTVGGQRLIACCIKAVDQARAKLSAPPAAGVPLDDPRGEFRGWFEGWVLENEHPGYGWLGEGSLDQGDTPNSYADQYVHGAWVMAMHLSVEIKRAQFHSHLHLQRAKLAESATPTPPDAGVPEDCVEPYGWVAAGRFFLDRDQAVEAAEKTPCVEVYSRPQMLATSPTPPASEPWRCQHCNSETAQACRDGGCFGVDAEPASEQQQAVVSREYGEPIVCPDCNGSGDWTHDKGRQCPRCSGDGVAEREVSDVKQEQQAVIQEVMEQCAMICEERRDYYNGGDDDGPDSRRGGACQNCADVIRYRMRLNPHLSGVNQGVTEAPAQGDEQ